MKRAFSTVVLLLTILACSQQASAQITKDPVAYMAKIGEAQEQVSVDFLSYLSAVAHGQRARKVEKRRTELMAAFTQSRGMVKNLPPFDGDTAYKHASWNYLNISYTILKEDYGKLVNMEEIAEQSYDQMEAYLNIQDKAQERLHEAFDSMDREQRAFAAAHNIKLVGEKSELSIKSEKVNKVNAYYHVMYLIFFKSYRQDLYLAEAITKKDINGIEQNKNSLLKTADEGLEKLKAMKAFDADASLAMNCKKLLEFYKMEVTKKVPLITEYYLKNEAFEKLKKAMDAKGGSRSASDVDQYNASAKEMNTAVVEFNKNNKDLYDTRTKLIAEWNNGVETFMDKHTPVYKK